MIILDIILSSEEKALEICSFLINKKYTLQTHIDANKIITSKGEKKTIRIFFITKALLYSEIEREVKQNYYSDDMLIYATPVSHINEEFGELIRSNIKMF